MASITTEQGLVESVRGPVITLRVAQPCPVFARFEATDGASVSVAQRLAPDRVLAIADSLDHRLAVGDILDHRPADAPVGLADAVLFAALAEFGSSCVGSSAAPMRLLETGIKAIDLLCPLTRGALVSVIGGNAVGRLTLIAELHHRLAETDAELLLVLPIVPRDAHTIPETLADQPGFPDDINGGVRTLWVVSPRADDPTLAELPALGAVRIVCSSRVPARGYWPAIDPLATCSSVALGEAHAAIAGEVRDLLRFAASVRADPEFEALARARDYAAALLVARRRDAELAHSLPPAESEQLKIARQLEHFLAQPFHAGEGLTGLAGTHVPMAATLEACLHRLVCGREPAYDFPEP